MKSVTISFLTMLCMPALFAGGLTEGQQETLLADSSNWPAFIQPNKDLTLPNDKVVKAWQRGVLIRLENDAPHVLVDFGREGIHRIAISDTNILEVAAAIESGKTGKAGANYLAMLGPPKLFHPRDGRSVAVTAEEAGNWEHLLFLYVPVSDIDWDLLEGLLEANETHLDSLSIKPILLPMGTYEEGVFFKPMVDKGLDIAVLYQFLSRGFILTLQHHPGDESLLVLTDMNGKVLSKTRELSVSGLAGLLTF